MSAHSSISSSSYSRAPVGPWGATLVLAIALLGIGFAALEMVWCGLGHTPGIADSMALWSKQRSIVDHDKNDPNVVCLIGNSRMQLGFNTRVFHEIYPQGKLANLSIDGTPALGILRDLADDESFRGFVIAGVTEPDFERKQWNLARTYVNFYHYTYRPSFDRPVDTNIKIWLQSHIISFHEILSTRSVARLVMSGKLPEPFYVTTLADRSQLAHYSMIADLRAHQQHRVSRVREVYAATPPETVKEWIDGLKDVRAWVGRINARGGRVVFVRMPTSDEYWRLDEARYPRRKYWDALASNVGAPTLHFADIPGMADFHLPDTSHLDAKDTSRFTEMLLDAIAKERALIGH